MRLTLHLGAYGTDGGLIARWISDNREVFAQRGAVAPPPRVFLSRLSETLDADRDADPHAREEGLLRALGANGQRRWMMVSAPGLLGGVPDIVAPDGFYVKDVARRLFGIRSLFPRCKMTVLLSLRRPSAMIPALMPGDPDAAAALLPMLSGETLPWARLVELIRQEIPQAQVVVWRHEDLAELWPEILSRVVGPERPIARNGLLDFAAIGLNEEARVRLKKYLDVSPPATAGQWRQVARVFGDRYGRETLPDPAEGLPGWARVELARLDRGYDTEWNDITGLSGVTALSPSN